MKKHVFTLQCLSLLSLTLLAGCQMMSLTQPGPGRLYVEEAHPVIPENKAVYQLQNIQQPETPIFIFASPKGLADCFLALKEPKNSKDICAKAIIAQVEDAQLVRVTHAQNPPYAIAKIHVIHPSDDGGTEGYVLWDWLRTPDPKLLKAK